MCLGSSEVPLQEKVVAKTSGTGGSVSSIKPEIVVEGDPELNFGGDESPTTPLSGEFFHEVSFSVNKKSISVFKIFKLFLIRNQAIRLF